MLDDIHGRQIIALVAESEIRRLTDRDSPCRHPFPEFGSAMAFQAPFGSVSSIVCKEHRQHFGHAHNAKEFSLVAKLHIVIRRWRCGTRQSIRYRLTTIDNVIASL